MKSLFNNLCIFLWHLRIISEVSCLVFAFLTQSILNLLLYLYASPRLHLLIPKRLIIKNHFPSSYFILVWRRSKFSFSYVFKSENDSPFNSFIYFDSSFLDANSQRIWLDSSKSQLLLEITIMTYFD